MSLAERIRKLREEKELSLDELATKAKISKTYLWELERDMEGTKKPSADVLLRIANALSSTLAALLALETVKIKEASVELTPSLKEFQNRMITLGTPLTPEDLSDLAVMKFRGGQPQTADEWQQLFLVLAQSIRKHTK
jgi:transcriptional regulator with XRE-family HTH domain